MRLAHSSRLLVVQCCFVLGALACGEAGPSEGVARNAEEQNEFGGGGSVGAAGSKSGGTGGGSGSATAGSSGRTEDSTLSGGTSGGSGVSESAGKGSAGASGSAGKSGPGRGDAGGVGGGTGAGRDGGMGSGRGGAAGVSGAASGRDGGATTGRDAGSGTGAGTGAAEGNCTFTASTSTSSKMGTVGVIEWSTDLDSPKSAQIVYSLQSPGAGVLNTGGTAPVDLTRSKYRTLLLGLKPSSKYTLHIEATSSSGETCKSQDYSLSTGTLSGTANVQRTASKPSAQAKGFIITSGGTSGRIPATIIDADGTVVWSASSPASCSRARMNYEGTDMWMIALNVMNSAGEMRRVSMDGTDSQNNVSGLSKSHHDFTVVKGGIVATLVWSTSGTDPESDLVERSPDGTVKTVFHVGSNLYKGGQSAVGGSATSYHSNSIQWHEKDDSYTIGDRNPSTFVKTTRAGKIVWQFGGSCSGAPATKCAAGDWNSNHGHHVMDDGTFLFFNNGPFQSSTASKGYEYKLNDSGSTLAATQVKSWQAANNAHSDSLGDIQRLPNGNTLVTYSNKGVIEEVDSGGAVVQSLSLGECGYSDWRETLYGPPPR